MKPSESSYQNPPIRLGYLLASIAIALLSMGTAGAQAVPALINYQGFLTKADGNPLDSKLYPLTFRIWNDVEAEVIAENLVWGETHIDVPVVRGRFNVILGGGTPLEGLTEEQMNLSGAFDEPNLFIGIAVDSIALAAEIRPRQQLLSAPYAFQSIEAEHALASDEADQVIGRVNFRRGAGRNTDFSINSSPSGWVDTGLEVTITTIGRPVVVSPAGGIDINLVGDSQVRVLRIRTSDSSSKIVYQQGIGLRASGTTLLRLPLKLLSFTDFIDIGNDELAGPAVDEYTYKLQFSTQGGGATVLMRCSSSQGPCFMTAREL